MIYYKKWTSIDKNKIFISDLNQIKLTEDHLRFNIEKVSKLRKLLTSLNKQLMKQTLIHLTIW